MLCFTNFFQVYIEMNQPVMAASLSLELGNALKVGEPDRSESTGTARLHLCPVCVVNECHMNYLFLSRSFFKIHPCLSLLASICLSHLSLSLIPSLSLPSTHTLSSKGDEQTGGGYSSLPKGCRVADTDSHRGSVVYGGNGHLQDSHP